MRFPREGPKNIHFQRVFKIGSKKIDLSHLTFKTHLHGVWEPQDVLKKCHKKKENGFSSWRLATCILICQPLGGKRSRRRNFATGLLGTVDGNVIPMTYSNMFNTCHGSTMSFAITPSFNQIIRRRFRLARFTRPSFPTQPGIIVRLVSYQYHELAGRTLLLGNSGSGGWICQK